jgi:hypothetical protein
MVGRLGRGFVFVMDDWSKWGIRCIYVLGCCRFVDDLGYGEGIRKRGRGLVATVDVALGVGDFAKWGTA